MKTHINFSKENDYKDAEFKLGDYVKVSKYKNIFAKGNVPNWSEDIFVIKKVKRIMLWTCFVEHLSRKKLLERFMKRVTKNK